MNLQETHTLRRLDETVYSGQVGVIGTQYGDVSVLSTRQHGFCAEVWENGHKWHAFGLTPTVAFLQLAGQLKAMNN